MEIKHFTHRHPLDPCEINQDEEDQIMCSGCQLEVFPGSSAFKCTKQKCDFILHKPCSELPRETRHSSHAHHTLTLHPTPPYIFNCDACGGGGGGAFVYNCYDCRFDLHVQCAALADSVVREDHCHPLQLVFSLPQRKSMGDKKASGQDSEKEDVEMEKDIEDEQEKKEDCQDKEEAANEGGEEDDDDEDEEEEEKEREEGYLCGVCRSGFIEEYWAYFCNDCDYGVHLDCATAEADRDDADNEEEEEEQDKDKDEDGDGDDVVAKRMRKIAVQQIIMNNQQTRMIISNS